MSASSKTEYLLNTFHLLNLRVITGFVNVCWMIFTSDETIKEEKQLRKKTKPSITIPKLTSKTDLERKDQHTNMTVLSLALISTGCESG